jgi:3-hydroxyisobutyrate dehydrogenase
VPLAGVHIAAAAEAIALGTRAGADPRVLLEVISNSAGSSWMFASRVPRMLAGDYTPHSAVDIFVKDLGIVLDAGKALRFPLPVAAAAHQQFLAAAAAGFGRADDAAVVKVYERLSGIDVAAATAAHSPPRV